MEELVGFLESIVFSSDDTGFAVARLKALRFTEGNYPMEIKMSGVKFYPEEFRRKLDAEKYQAKGTCEILLTLDHLELEVKNITYRIEHEWKVLLKPPYRMHSNKKAGIKPKLVPSVVFKEPVVLGGD